MNFARHKSLKTSSRRTSKARGLTFESLEGRIVLTAITALGTEAIVPSYSTESWQNPEVASDSDGNSVVVFQSPYTTSTNGDVFAQRLDSTGALVGTTFQVNTFTNAIQGNAKVAMDDDGDFVVTWAGTGPGFMVFNIVGQIYNSSGVAQGSNFAIAQVTEPDADYSLGMDSDGDFVVTWQALGGFPSSPAYSIFARGYDLSGSSNFSPTQVTGSAEDVRHSSVSMDAAGNFVIAYGSTPTTIDPISSIVARIFDPSGTDISGAITVNTTDDVNVNSPEVSVNGEGEFAVTWLGVSSSQSAVFVRAFDADGTPVTSQIVVDTSSSTTPYYPDVAIDANANFVVTWQESTTGPSAGDIYAKSYGPTGTATHDKTLVSSSTNTGSSTYPAIAITPSGQIIVVWQGYDYVNSNGTILRRLYQL